MKLKLIENPITYDQALTAREFHAGNCTREIGPRGGVREKREVWRRNGRTKIWKTRPGEFQIPVKHGMRDYGYITQDDENVHAPEDCPLEQTRDAVSGTTRISRPSTPSNIYIPTSFKRLVRSDIGRLDDSSSLEDYGAVDKKIEAAYNEGIITYEERSTARKFLDDRMRKHGVRGSGLQLSQISPPNLTSRESADDFYERLERGELDPWKKNPGTGVIVIVAGILSIVAIKVVSRWQ